MQTLPTVDRSKWLATLFLMIDDEKLRSMFNGLAEAGRGQIYIVDASNRIVSSTSGAFDMLPYRYSDMPGDQGKLEERVGREKTIVSYATSSVYGWKYVMEVPRSVFLKDVEEIRRWALLLFIIAACMGGAVSGYMAYRNYRPIRDLMLAATRTGSSSRKQAPFEYEVIRTSIQSAKHAEAELRGRLEQQTPIIRVHLLNRLIKGYADPYEIHPDSLKFMGIEFESERFAVMLIDVEDIGAFSAENDPKEVLLVNFIISNIALDLINERHAGYATELDPGRIAVLVNFGTDEPEAGGDGLDKVAERLEQVLSERFRLKTAIGISDSIRDIQTIGAAFRDSLKKLEENRRSHAVGHGQIALPEQAPEYFYPIDIEQQLTNYVKSGEEEKMETLLDGLFADHGDGDADGGHYMIDAYFLIHLSATLLRIVQSTPKADRVLALRLKRTRN